MSEPNSEKDCTVGICPCGGVVYARAPPDEGEREYDAQDKRQIAREIHSLISDGMRIETWKTQAVRDAKWGHSDECGFSKSARARKAKRQTEMFA